MFDSDNSKVLLFSPDSSPYGVSFSEWTAKWWQWALSIPVEENPVKHETGDNCAINQTEPVWFLAGTDGGFAERRCTVPLGSAILLPILNHGGTLADTLHVKSEDELIFFTNREMDIISNLEVIVDDAKLVGLERYRVQSPIFDVVLPKNNLFNGRPGPTKGVSDGYWLFFRPLPRGEHKIHTFGSCLAGKVKIYVDYSIVIS
jgi:hypothetical protein